jgi:hypothetical protein
MAKPVTDNGHHAAAELLAFTIDPRTGRIVKLEGLTADGARHELTDEEKARLSKRPRAKTVERVVERAFEAGIACVLDGNGAEDDSSESSDDVDLTHRLLVPLIEHSAAKQLMAREVVDRTVLDTLIEHSLVSPHPAGAEIAADLR